MVGVQLGAWRVDVRDLPGTVAGLFRLLPPQLNATAEAAIDGCRQALTPHGLRRFLDIAEPFLVGAIQRVGAGAPEVVALLVAVKMVQHILRHAAES